MLPENLNITPIHVGIDIAEGHLIREQWRTL